MDLQTAMTKEDMMSDPCGMIDKGLACFGDCTDTEIDAVMPGTSAQTIEMKKKMGCGDSSNAACSNVMGCIFKEMPSSDQESEPTLQELCAANSRALACVKGCEDSADPS